VLSADVVLPEEAPEWAKERAELWNAAERAETRKNATVAREFEVALPDELNPKQRREVALQFAKELVRKHGFAADVAIHKPSPAGDERNHHAHILVSSRRLGPEGFTEKTRELDDQKSGPELVKHWRERWAQLVNERLREQERPERIDHRTLEAQGIDREPGKHLGPAATNRERREQEQSRRGPELERQRQENAHLREQAKEQARQEARSQVEEAQRELADVQSEREKAQEHARAEREEAAKQPPAPPTPPQLSQEERAAILAKAREATAKRRMELEQEATRRPAPQRTEPTKEQAKERSAPAPEPRQKAQEPPPPAQEKPLDMAAGLAAARARFEEMKRQKEEQERAQRQAEQQVKRSKHRDREEPER